MATERGLKPSKKFANGTVHENGTGKFEILDRFLEDNIIMLKFKWLNGEFEGQVETNKEVNVNASIWKFKKVRGLVGKDKDEEVSNNEAFEEIKELLEEANEHREEVYRHMETQNNKAMEQQDTMIKMLNTMDKFIKEREDQINHMENLEERIARLDKQLHDSKIQIDRLVSLAETNAVIIDKLTSQYDIASKLIDKM